MSITMALTRIGRIGSTFLRICPLLDLLQPKNLAKSTKSPRNSTTSTGRSTEAFLKSRIPLHFAAVILALAPPRPSSSATRAPSLVGTQSFHWLVVSGDRKRVCTRGKKPNHITKHSDTPLRRLARRVCKSRLDTFSIRADFADLI